MNKEKKQYLAEMARRIRVDAIKAIHSAKAGHPGGALSIAEILSYLYFEEMNIDPKDPKKEDRDRFVLSKGHASAALYAALAERGFFDKELLLTFRKNGSILQGHPDMKHIPGVDMSTGSLGQGISAACGMALASKLSDKPFRVYAILGDGEIEEGQVWEAAMFAHHYKLDNLCAFVDFNGLQVDGTVQSVIDPTPIDKKFAAFGWNVLCIDGADLGAIEKAVNTAKKTKDKPTVVIAKTVKGRGVSYMENAVGWHGKAPNDEEFATAMRELGETV